MSLITAIDINVSGLTAQRQRVELSSANLANSQTTRTKEGGAYHRKDVIFESVSFGGAMDTAAGLNAVRVSGVVEDQTPLDRRWEPGHPDADAQGFVEYPNVRSTEEVANLIEASRSYEANIAAINIAKAMISKTLELGR